VDPRLAIAGVVVLVLGTLLVFLTVRMSDTKQDRSVNLVILVLGVCVGWLLGILLSPYDAGEEQRFEQYAGAFSVFASGYLLGKVDRVIGHLLSPEVLLSPLVGFRVASFTCMTIFGMVLTFAIRKYA